MGKHRLYSIWPLSLLVMGGLLVALGFPHLMSAYHLEAGGRAIENRQSPAYDPSPALEHLRKAVEWAPNNAQAYRLLGKVYREQGDVPAAVEALARHNELQPRNPLGHIEMAETYEMVEATMATMRYADLLTLFPQAEVKALDVPSDTPFGQPDDPTWRYYVARTSFSLPPNADKRHPLDERPTLFMHPPSWVTYTLSLPPQPALLRFGLGMDPQTHDWPVDGVTFEVFVNGERTFLEHVDKAMARQGWHERAVELAPWAGQEVALALRVTPGPTGGTAGDWAGWGEPQVVDKRLPALETLEPSVRMVAAWRRAGLNVEDLIARGEQSKQAKLYDDADTWYERATRFEPGLGDPWYYRGQLHEDQEQWPQALDAYQRAIASERLRHVGRSNPHYRMGVIYQWRLNPRRLDDALAAYEDAVTADDFSTATDAAQAHYQYGYALHSRDADANDYIAAFQRAIELNPKHTWAHIMLGLAIYKRDKDAVGAEAELLAALELAPNSTAPLYHLGELYRQEGRMDEAAAMYERALQIDPDFEAAQKGLAALREGG